MSGSDRLSASGRQLLLALGSEPLDIHQLAAGLVATRVVVAAELQMLVKAGLVHGATMQSGRQARASDDRFARLTVEFLARTGLRRGSFWT